MKIKAFLTAALLAAAVAAPLAAPAEEKDDVKRAAPKAAAEEPYVVEAEIGIGYDSNAYLAPTESYDDYTQDIDPATPGIQPRRIDPVIHSGFFIPIELKAKYARQMDGTKQFLAGFSFDADIYPQSETENANEYSVRLKAGVESVLNKKNTKEDTFYIGPFIGYRKEIYFDRDEGVDKVIGVTNVSTLYNYVGVGIEAEYKNRTTVLSYGLKAEIEKRSYDDPGGSPAQDHLYYAVGGDVDFVIARPSKLNLSYTYSVRDYDERHARGLDTFFSATTLKYTYHEIGASLRNKLANWLVVYLDYDLTLRTDEYVGYNDYTKNSYRIRIITREGKGTKLQAWFTYWDRDYPNAFAFDVSGQSQKTYDGIEAKVKGDFALNKHWGLWAEYKYGNQNSTDLRYDYDRYQAMAGVKWEM